MQDNRNTYLIAGGVLVLIGVYFTFSQLSQSTNPNEGPGVVTYKKVDRLKKDVLQQKRLQQDKAMVDNFKNAPSLPTGYRQVKDSSVGDSGLRLQSSQSHAAFDSGEDSSREAPQSLQVQINDFLLKKQRYEQLTQLQRQKYVSDFKREAQAMGYAVEFNDKLEVVRFDRVPASQANKPALKVIPPPPPPSSGVDSQENYEDAEEE
ncbi:MAG: hypothetical protein K2Q26_09550 [Bdellovibrionales bacterium]|nr:hypothetical protein [Bdellovibrionales bacterium]